MKNIQATPLLILFAGQLLSSIYVLIPSENDGQGWNFLTSGIMFLSAFAFLIFNFILKRYIQDKERLLLMQFLVAAILVFCYLLWELTIFSL
jgi:hypothetical protein